MNLRSFTDQLMKAIFALAGLFTVAVLLGILVLLVQNGVKAFQHIPFSSFFGSVNWNPSAHGESSYGILQLLWSSLLVTGGALAIAIPLGIGTAAYLSEVATPKTRKLVKPIIEILAGIPSVAIGFIGIVLIGPAIATLFGLNNGFNALNGSVLLAFMSLPTIISVSEDAMQAVPQSFREGSYALGANKWTTLVKVVLPAAASGIIAAFLSEWVASRFRYKVS